MSVAGMGFEGKSGLTPREHDVMQQLASGLRVRQMSESLGVSESTVKYHLKNIYAKLGAEGRKQAVSLYGHQSLPARGIDRAGRVGRSALVDAFADSNEGLKPMNLIRNCSGLWFRKVKFCVSADFRFEGYGVEIQGQCPNQIQSKQ